MSFGYLTLLDRSLKKVWQSKNHLKIFLKYPKDIKFWL